jgi:hypothetical protein
MESTFCLKSVYYYSRSLFSLDKNRFSSPRRSIYLDICSLGLQSAGRSTKDTVSSRDTLYAKGSVFELFVDLRQFGQMRFWLRDWAMQSVWKTCPHSSAPRFSWRVSSQIEQTGRSYFKFSIFKMTVKKDLSGKKNGLIL